MKSVFITSALVIALVGFYAGMLCIGFAVGAMTVNSAGPLPFDGSLFPGK